MYMKNPTSFFFLFPLFLLSVSAAPAVVAQSPAGYSLESPSLEDDGVIRILLYYDMKSLSGQTDWRIFLFRYSEQYQQGQELLAADVNAVVDGLFAGGADEVHIVDFQSSGNPAPDLPALVGLPGYTYNDGEVSFVAPDFQTAYDGWHALIRVAQAGYMGVLFETLDNHPAGTEILDTAWDRHFTLWFDVESGRYIPPPTEPEERRKYHGVQ
jgi:hypothetical protein